MRHDLDCVPGASVIRFQFERLRRDVPEIKSWADALLRVVGDFRIVVSSNVVYSETEYCVVEFGYHLHRWLVCQSPPLPDFAYNSMESDDNPVVWFERVGADWRLGAFGQDSVSERIPNADLKAAARAFLTELDARTRTEVDLQLLPVLVDVGRSL